MVSYRKIKNLYEDLIHKNSKGENCGISEELVELLNLIEKINPCEQKYELVDDCIIISYKLKINVFNFKNIMPLKIKTEIIGLPISLSQKGYFGDFQKVKKIVEARPGLKLILNSNTSTRNAGRTLSSFIFYNNFKSFEHYIDSLRSNYRRRLNIALKKREKLLIKRINNEDFDSENYQMYLSIMKRTKNRLEILPIEFFREYNSEIYEFLDKGTNEKKGFIQVRKIGDKLLFLFGGFNKEDNKKYDLYFNMLLKIVEIGIERKVKSIEFGQTAEASKLKIGCIEKEKYLYIHHSNKILNALIRPLIPIFSYKQYGIKHNVFKD